MTTPSPDLPDPAADDGSMELSLEDTLAQKMRGLPSKTRVPATPHGKGRDRDKARQKPTDLRTLSEWIRLSRQINQLKK